VSIRELASGSFQYRTASALFRTAFDDDVVVRVPVRSRKHKPKRQVEPQVFLERGQAKAVLASRPRSTTADRRRRRPTSAACCIRAARAARTLRSDTPRSTATV
jgi:hypothetical protein